MDSGDSVHRVLETLRVYWEAAIRSRICSIVCWTLRGTRSFLLLMLLQYLFDFCNEEWQIRAGKAQFRRWDAVMLDVGWHVLVMRISQS